MQYYGIDIDGNHIFLAVISGKKNDILIRDLQIFDTNDLNDVKQLYKWLHKSNKLIVCGLESKKILYKSLSIQKPSNIFSRSIRPDTSTLFNLDIKDSILQTKKNNHSGYSIFSNFITSKSHVKNYIEQCSMFNIDPDFVSSKDLAIYYYSKKYYPHLTNACVFYIGYKNSSCVVIKNGFLDKCFPINCHVASLEKQSTNFSDSLNSMITTYLGVKKQLPVLFLGQIDKASFVIHKFIADLNIKTFFSNNETNKQNVFAPAIGLALEHICEKKPLQFKLKEWVSINQLKKLSRNVLLYYSLSCLFVMGSLFSGLSFINIKKNQLTKAISLFYEKERKAFIESEKDSTAPVYKRLDALKNHLERQTRIFPYYVLAPKITEVFQKIGFLELTQKNVELTGFLYQLESYPKIGKPQSPYILRIELDFITKDFNAYNDLKKQLGSDPSINPKKGIKWEINDSQFKAIFYLKQKNIQDLFNYEHQRKDG